jgi:NADPH-dependent 2,4-dienoyl-CoA reductase/sulfur reductase-like enzyme
MGVEVISGQNAIDGNLNFIELENGEKVKFDVLINAAGTLSDLSFIPKTVELGKNFKIKVDENFSTSVENLYSIGDCAIQDKLTDLLFFALQCHFFVANHEAKLSILNSSSVWANNEKTKRE